MKMRQNEEFYWEKIQLYLQKVGNPNSLVLNVRQIMELLQFKSNKTVYLQFEVVGGKVQVAEVVKYLCKLGKCKSIGA